VVVGHAHRRGLGRAVGAAVALLSTAGGCGDVEVVRLADALPEDLVYPVALIHLYEGGDGPVFFAESAKDLEDLDIFMAESDELLLASNIVLLARLDECTSFSMQVACNDECFQYSESQSRLSIDRFVPIGTNGETIRGIIQCEAEQLGDCKHCF
jgi:hypothetical protein